jgi:hypothetical protein
MQKHCNVVLSTITKSVEILRAVTLVKYILLSDIYKSVLVPGFTYTGIYSTSTLRFSVLRDKCMAVCWLHLVRLTAASL